MPALAGPEPDRRETSRIGHLSTLERAGLTSAFERRPSALELSRWTKNGRTFSHKRVESTAIRGIPIQTFSGLRGLTLRRRLLAIVAMEGAPPMCRSCDQQSRRWVLSFLATGAVAAGLLGAGAPRSLAAGATTLTADEALAKLKAGNQKFLTAPQLCTADMAKQRADVAEDQSPWATILTCSDSRVSPELIFGGVGLGELFVVRNAGNVADTAAMGTIEYGAEHLGSPLVVVVLGHQRCGAVEASYLRGCRRSIRNCRASSRPWSTRSCPRPRLCAADRGISLTTQVRENARLVAQKISTRSKIVEDLEHEGKVKVVYARYDLDKGVVDFL